ncbi:hypothetical protein JCM19296_3235 [Nonlabens ulvanivorans]|uniref:Uncharacterized protein n=1 Tax=Nonlabens ulvanivorans TaxID=906888 RepID=A0A081DFD1_NONUL|nr:hypothetical protein [Nonlabens ulvanivorans]GAK77627.1 hypothetical protein JCM19296_3235 [Nonlabens ulvanivorans]
MPVAVAVPDEKSIPAVTPKYHWDDSSCAFRESGTKNYKTY